VNADADIHAPGGATVEALAGRVRSGGLVAIAPDYSWVPMALVRALIRGGVRDLHLLTVPISGIAADLLIGAGCVGTLEAAAVSLGEAGPAPRFTEAVERGAITMRDSTCPAIHTALQASEKGVPFMPLGGLVGSDIVAARDDWKVVDDPLGRGGGPVVLLPAIRPDVALFHSPRADRHGNVWIGRRRELMTMAHAARETLVTVEAVVDEDLLADEATAAGTLSSLYVTAVAEAKSGAWPLGVTDLYERDLDHIRAYAEAARTADGFKAYLDQYVFASRQEARTGPGGAGVSPETPRARTRKKTNGGVVTRAVSFSDEELLICVLARLLEDVGHVAVGALSPVPGCAALLAQCVTDGKVRVSIIHGDANNPFTDGGREIFDCAGQGRIGAFFLGGAQIDGRADINLLGLGPYPKLEKRFPGSFGSAYMYFTVPTVILFAPEHSRRVLVNRVDFVSAPGTSPPEVHRPGGPKWLATGRCLMAFDAASARFRLVSVHPGNTVEDILGNTGFEFDFPADGPDSVPETPAPEPERLELLRTVVGAEIAKTYPAFAERVFGGVAAA